MRLIDYKTKFFGFLAGNLRRLAEALSDEATAAKKEISAPPSADEKPLSAREDWLEKTRGVSFENWVDFSAGNEPEPGVREDDFEPEIQTAEDEFAGKAFKEDFSAKKPEKSPPTETLSGAGREASETSEIFDTPKPPDKPETASGKTEKPGKPKAAARFFSFGFSGRKKKREENDEAPSPQSLSEISRQSAVAKDEKSPETAKRNFRLFPAEKVSEGESETPAPNAASFAENQPQTKFEIPPLARKKSAVKFAKIAPAKPKTAAEKPESIAGKPSGREKIPSNRQQISDRFPFPALQKTSGEPAAEINFEFPKRKTNSAIVFSSKAEPASAETPDFSSSGARKNQKRQIRAREYFNPERDKKTDDTTDNTERFAVAESPWIDLPDEPAFEAADDIQTSLSENEHLRFLEDEQAGNT